MCFCTFLESVIGNQHSLCIDADADDLYNCYHSKKYIQSEQQKKKSTLTLQSKIYLAEQINTYKDYKEQTSAGKKEIHKVHFTNMLFKVSSKRKLSVVYATKIQ